AAALRLAFRLSLVAVNALRWQDARPNSAAAPAIRLLVGWITVLSIRGTRHRRRLHALFIGAHFLFSLRGLVIRHHRRTRSDQASLARRIDGHLRIARTIARHHRAMNDLVRRNRYAIALAVARHRRNGDGRWLDFRQAGPRAALDPVTQVGVRRDRTNP